MTIKIASTTDTETAIEAAMTKTDESPVGELSASQADGVPHDDVAPESTEESVEVSAPDTEVVDSEPDSETGAAEEETGAPDQITVSEDDLNETPKPKRRRRGRSYKDRASALAREKAEEKQRADALEAELYRARQQPLQQPPPPQEPRPSEPTPAEAAPATPTDGRPNQDDFETYEAFSEAMVDWKVDQRMGEFQAQEHERIERAQEQRAREEIVARHQARIDTFRSSHDDFDAVFEQGRNLPVTPPMRDAVLNSEAGPALMYHLCSNPDECDRIANMHPMAAIKEMGKLEAQIEAASQTGPSSSARPVTQAPPPIQPVGGGATTSTTPLDQLPYQEFKRIRNEQERVAREQGR